MKLDIKINEEYEGDYLKLQYDLLGVKRPRAGKEITPVDGVKLKYKDTLVVRAIYLPPVIHLILGIAKDVGVGLFSAWLYDKLRGKDAKLKIDDEEVEIDISKIEEKIRVKLKKKKR